MAAPNAGPLGENDGKDDAIEPTGDGSTGAPGTPPDDLPDVDARWADIVADLADVSAAAEAAAADPAHGTGPDADRGSATGPRDLHETFPVAPWVQGPGPRDWPATPEVEELEDAESHFTPPDPDIGMGRDPLMTMAWGLVVGVPILLLVGMVVLRPFPTIVAQVAGGLFLVGLAVLLWRMPHRREDDHSGPGAVV
ncbi:hypothetical protein H9623_09800 [Oerskovia sp. Sa1BUA8]|uniref:DUF308 domain-containing protein n=1 Tax=Oerskovia douganii TaxID=2762210 RepID=A0A9D5YYG1_9CELL|nr:hypothetical protein [Oerskovia douganii]MBE7700598.1 hypothetical protein [Oerskovia douganii]